MTDLLLHLRRPHRWEMIKAFLDRYEEKAAALSSKRTCTGPGMASHHLNLQKNILAGRAERSWPKPQPRRGAATSLSAAAPEEPTESFCMRVFNFEFNVITIKSWPSAEFAQIVTQRTEPLFLRPESLKHQVKSAGSIIGQLVLLRPE